jgi:hypothetical protein
VKEACGTLLKMVSHDSDGKPLGWSHLVGNETQLCPFLPGGKKISYYKALKFPRGSSEEEKNTIVNSVRNFINNARKKNPNTPDWKRELLGQLELDICDDTSEEGCCKSAKIKIVESVKKIILNPRNKGEVTISRGTLMNKLESVSNVSKCSGNSAHKNKKPPKKKTMETKVNKKRPHALWNRNYKIVKETCGTLLKMVSHDSDGKRLSWSQLVGNEREDCPFLPGGKKFTYCKALKFPRGATVKEKNTIAQSVQSFINNAKKNQKTFPDWKRELLGQLELDICDDTRVWLL